MTEPSDGDGPHAWYFSSLRQQVHAARLGVWIFLGSETLLFAALFALYGSYRKAFPTDFPFGISHNARLLGSANTFILLLSSLSVACSTLTLRQSRRAVTMLLIASTLLLGGLFLVVKTVEYSMHFEEGIGVDGTGAFFVEHPRIGLSQFFQLYFLMTGLHALHVIAGMAILSWLLLGVVRRKIDPPLHHPLELGALYWHLVDIVWIFLWPLFYLTGGGGE